MKRETIGLIAITVFMTVLVGSVSAQSLTELRASQETDRVNHHRIQSHRRDRSERVRYNHRDKQSVTKKRQLARAKRRQRNVDRKLDRKQVKIRNFKTVKQFKKVNAAKRRMASRYAKHVNGRYRSDRVAHRDHLEHGHAASKYHRGRRSDRYDTWYDDRWDRHTRWQPRHLQRGYRHTRRNWYLSYLYERASFYDRYGYKYGYFSRRGFMFEGEFYRYDRAYTYRDRLRGRGLFERRYYRPAYSQFDDLFAGIDREGFSFYAGFGL